MPSLCRAHGPVLYLRADGNRAAELPRQDRATRKGEPPLPAFSSWCAYGGPVLLFSAPHPWALDRRLRPVNAAWRLSVPPRSRNEASPGGPAIPMTADQLGPLAAAETAEPWFFRSINMS